MNEAWTWLLNFTGVNSGDNSFATYVQLLVGVWWEHQHLGATRYVDRAVSTKQ